MRMSHVDQPLMLMELLGRRSPAPAQDVARRILGEDVTQIDYYTERVKRMVGKVLTGNGITRYDQGAYDLVGGEELSDAEREELLQLCRQRLDTFREQRGEEVFAHRSRHRTPIGGSIKVRVLTRAKGRCECCGAHEHQRALEVDHIVPRNHGGSDDLSNLQALCIADDYPVTPGHSLVIPRRHGADGLVGVAPAGMECCGGAAEAAAGGAKRPRRHGQRLGWCVMTIRAGLDRSVRP
jgi:hypothetical protein